MSNCRYSTSILRKAFSWTENSLENLWLDFGPGVTYQMPSADLDPISSLSSFKFLKNIKVGMSVIFGREPVPGNTGHPADGDAIDLANRMPTSIETIYFSHTLGRVRGLLRALENWLLQKEALKRIAFEAYTTKDNGTFDFSRLDSLAEEAGVEISKSGATTTSICNRAWSESTSSVSGRGQGFDGSLTWAAKETMLGDPRFPSFIDAGR